MEMREQTAVERLGGVNHPRGALPLLVRATSHVIVWTSVLAPMWAVLSKGWIPMGDDAAIAIRSFQTISFHPPLVGLTTTAGILQGHYLNDPGPLLFWLLAIPVHIDPNHGALWAAAILAGAALSLSVEAVWSTKLWPGCAVVAFAAADLMWLTPEVFERITWNAYFPIPFFIATVVLAWTVSMGLFGWWPALVFVASVAAQCHLIFVIPAILLSLVAPGIGLAVAGKPKRFRWLIGGLAVALACWIAPLTQNFAANGNLTALIHGNSGLATEGLGVGLRALARAASPLPIWLTHEPSLVIDRAAFPSYSSPAAGGIVLCILAAIAIWAWRSDRRELAALSSIALACSIGLVADFSMFPKQNALAILDYLIISCWVVGILIWTVVVWAVASLASRLLHRRTRHELILGVLAGTLLITVIGVLGLTAFQPADSTVGWNQSDVKIVDHVVKAVERYPRNNVVMVSVNRYPSEDFFAGGLAGLWVEGIAWQLEADGWRPRLRGFGALYTGLGVSRGTHVTNIVVNVHGTDVVSVNATGCIEAIRPC